MTIVTNDDYAGGPAKPAVMKMDDVIAATTTMTTVMC